MAKRKEIEKLWGFVESNLKPAERKMVYLHYKERLRNKEIAELLQIHASTSYFRLQRCIKRLRYEYLIIELLPQIEEILSKEEFQTFLIYLQLRNQTKMANSLKVSQPYVSMRLKKIKEKISEIPGKEIKEFLKLFRLRFGFWGWPNEKKIYSNALIKKGEQHACRIKNRKV